MRRINHSRAFRRDYRREKRGQHGRNLDEQLDAALQLLANDQPLPPRYRDHPMHGNRGGERNCHIRPDLVLIYTKPNPTDINLIRLGSHSDLFT
jgi:mRNA interferase YafQ